METKGIRRVILAAIAILICFSFSDFYFGGNYQTGGLARITPYNHKKLFGINVTTKAHLENTYESSPKKLLVDNYTPGHNMQTPVTNRTSRTRRQEHKKEPHLAVDIPTTLPMLITASSHKPENTGKNAVDKPENTSNNLEKAPVDNGKLKKQGENTSNNNWRERIQNIIESQENVFPRESDAEESPLGRTFDEYCNPPSLEVGEEGDVDEKIYKLKQVHVIIRHGDRSPLSRSYLPGKINVTKTSCLTEPSKFPTDIGSHVLRFKEDAEIWSKNHQTDKFKLFPNKTKCEGGKLTGVGVAQHLLHGLKLRNTYIRKHNLIPPDWNSSHVHIITTWHARTYQSAMALLYGLLNTFDQSKRGFEFVSPLFCYSGTSQFTGVPCNSEGASLINKLGLEQPGNLPLSDKKFASLRDEYRKEIAKLAGVGRWEVPWAKNMLDILSSYECHGKSLPCYGNGERCFTKDLVSKLLYLWDRFYKATTRNIYAQVSNRLQIHQLMTYILKHIENSAKNSNLKFVLYSGHDNSVTPIAVALGFGVTKYPAYAAKIAFEFYENRKESSGYYLKILHDGKDITKTVVFCRGKNNSDGLCPLAAFKAYVDQTQTLFSSVSNIYAESLKKP